MTSSRRFLILALVLVTLQAVSAGAAGAPAPAGATPFQPDPLVASLIAQVGQQDLYEMLRGLSGETPITVGGQSATLITRNTESAQIDTATAYAYEFFQAHGLLTSYHEWEGEDDYGDWLAGQNVVAEIHGSQRPHEVVLVTAHLDDINEDTHVDGRAPGADDNASGSAAVMTAAALLAGHPFERTLRFVLFTGEEQGLLGSAGYAQDCQAAGENLVAVLNMDMIAWDDNDDGALYLETRRTSSAGYPADLAIANTLIEVVEAYGLETALELHVDPCSDPWVDSWSFWSAGFPSVTAIEDWDWEEMNPYYHSAGDTVATLNLPYYTANVKAIVGTAAELAMPGATIEYDHWLYLPLVTRGRPVQVW